jgi:hypothetical protein
MNDLLSPAQDRLIALLEEAARGPKRNGVYAIWLFVRACEGELPPDQLSFRARRRRLTDLEKRLSSLSLQPPLKRALGASLGDLSEHTHEGCVRALRQLVTPTREHLGSAAGDAVSLAARTAKDVVRHGGVAPQ